MYKISISEKLAKGPFLFKPFLKRSFFYNKMILNKKHLQIKNIAKTMLPTIKSVLLGVLVRALGRRIWRIQRILIDFGNVHLTISIQAG